MCSGFTKKTLFPQSPLYGVGVSLGSIILVKYLAEEGARCPLVGAMYVYMNQYRDKSSELYEYVIHKIFHLSFLSSYIAQLINFSRSISNPWCLHASSQSLETTMSRALYNSRLTKGLQ